MAEEADGGVSELALGGISVEPELVLSQRLEPEHHTHWHVHQMLLARLGEVEDSESDVAAVHLHNPSTGKDVLRLADSWSGPPGPSESKGKAQPEPPNLKNA